MNQPELGKKIAELRKAKGLTQEELVEKCNLNVRTLQRIESGEVIPRSYTIKIIFAALDYKVFDSTEINKRRFLISNWLEQFYQYVLDLFNLKTNTMKKITIFSIVFSVIIFGLFALSNEISAQKENKSASRISDNAPTNELSNCTITVTGSYNGWDSPEEFVGRDVNITFDGVTFKSPLIRINKRTREFRSFFVGKLDYNKVEIVDCNLDLVEYTADDNLEISPEKIILKGNAKLTYLQNETIEADEIIITKK